VRVLIFNLFFYGFTFSLAMACYGLAKLSTRAAVQRACGFWGRTVRGAVHVVLKGEIEVRGRHRLPEGGPQLLVAKHQSELDIVMLGVLFPNAGAVAMQELTRYPFFGPILKKLDMVMVAVDRGRQGRTQQAVEGALRIQAEGRPMIIYPEGELMELGAKERYRRGVGHIYKAMGVPAVPVAVSLGVIWPRRKWRKHVGKRAAYEFLEPIPPGLEMEDFMAEIECRIEEGTMRLIREHASGPELAAAEDRYARGVNNHGEVPKAATTG